MSAVTFDAHFRQVRQRFSNIFRRQPTSALVDDKRIEHLVSPDRGNYRTMVDG